MSGFMDALLKRRSVYGISSENTLPDDELKALLGDIIKNLPTAYNMQGTRMVLLLGQNHLDFWNDIVLETLRGKTTPDKFPRTQSKIAGFAAGHGTILYFNDEDVTKQFMEENKNYAENFPPWVLQHNGMLQVSVWMVLAEAGMGASLQHYNPIIDEQVKARWKLPENWKLLAQMPFGKTVTPAGEKTFVPLEERFKIFE
ncbi:nitroreductase family protein [Clostridia bacterium OttesenSCG-928-O13]|nr:nitroreductase family protein [Clostridia bacterium OttesenSCG-928-O13]